jgi:hypothetical protein
MASGLALMISAKPEGGGMGLPVFEHAFDVQGERLACPGCCGDRAGEVRERHAVVGIPVFVHEGDVVPAGFQPLDQGRVTPALRSQLFIVGRNIEHQLFGFWIGQTFRHPLGSASALDR